MRSLIAWIGAIFLCIGVGACDSDSEGTVSQTDIATTGDATDMVFTTDLATDTGQEDTTDTGQPDTGDDTGTDTGDDTGEDTARDAGDDGVEEVNCTLEDDGTQCGENQICLRSACSPSFCGDEYVDADTGEECDDGLDGDDDNGCTDLCQFTCDTSADCDDTDLCNGAEICGVDHTCAAGAEADDGVTCEATDPLPDTDYVCFDGRCLRAGCGNEILQTDDPFNEQCDDGADGDDLDGCTDNCEFTCQNDDFCDDIESVCSGNLTCVAEGGVQFCDNTAEPLAPDCNDLDDCTADSCNADYDGDNPDDACVNVFIDGDSDKFSPNLCSVDGLYVNEGGDCADDNPLIYPCIPDDPDGDCDNEYEVFCTLDDDGVDSDCDLDFEDGMSDLTCYEDTDLDGVAEDGAATMDFCPSCCEGDDTNCGWAPTEGDCHPDNGLPVTGSFAALVYPGQDAYFTSSYCLQGGCTEENPASFDYNCSDDEESSRASNVFTGCSGIVSCGGSGWVGSIPDCGDNGDYIRCVRMSECGPDFCVLFCGAEDAETVTNSCH